jgi:flagellar hook-associated protein 2
MASFTSLGVGSGLDLESLVQGLMNIERLPIAALQKQVASYNTRISALGTLSSKLSGLQTAAKALVPDTLQTALQKFTSYTAGFADETFGSAVVGDGAIGGSYNLHVDKLASAQKIKSIAMPETLPTGTVTIEFGTLSGGAFTPDAARQFTIEVTASNNSPEGLARAINQANIGISATLVDGDNGPQLVLTGKEGSDQAFKLSGLGSDYDPANPSASTSFSQVAGHEAGDARLTLDGISITSKSNTIKDALTGVTLTLNKTGDTTLTVKEDNTTRLKAALEEFVKAYNEAASSMNALGAYDSETKVAGALQGNRILREAQNALSKLVFGQPGDAMKLSDIGITFKSSDGTLSLDSDKLAAAIAKDPEAVANFVGGKEGVGDKFSATIENLVGISGSIPSSTDSLKTSVRDLEKRQEALELRLVSVEARYRKQFAALDTLMANLNSTSAYLTQQLASLSQISSSSKK